MSTFHYFPPGPEEQKNFVLQCLGTLLSLAVAAFLFFVARDAALKTILVGAGAAVLWMLARSAWQLEIKAARAQNAEIEISDEAVLLTDARGQTQRILWNEIEKLEVRGGRLTISWDGGEIALGAREIENGMELVREITQRHSGKKTWSPPSNFIPLEPK